MDRVSAREPTLLLQLAVAEIVVVGGISVVLLKVHGADPFVTYTLGALHMATLTLGYYALRIGFLTSTKDAIWQARGDLGEVNTRDELKRAKRRRLVWGWIDSITVSTGDVDHLVATRQGGVVAIDSKWRSDTVGADIRRAAVSARRAAHRAESVMRHLGYFKREQTARRRSAAAAITVTPLVALWSPVRHDLPPDVRVDGVDFIAGPELISWLRIHRSEPVSRAAGQQIVRDLRDFRDQHQPSPVVLGPTRRSSSAEA